MLSRVSEPNLSQEARAFPADLAELLGPVCALQEHGTTEDWDYRVLALGDIFETLPRPHAETSDRPLPEMRVAAYQLYHHAVDCRSRAREAEARLWAQGWRYDPEKQRVVQIPHGRGRPRHFLVDCAKVVRTWIRRRRFEETGKRGGLNDDETINEVCRILRHFFAEDEVTPEGVRQTLKSRGRRR
jgi:hypothetical protein